MEGHNVDMRAIVNMIDMQSLAFPADLIQHRYLVSASNSQVSGLGSGNNVKDDKLDQCLI